MKKLFFILTILTFFQINTARASCSDYFPLPEIELYASYGKLKYDYSKNTKQITSMAKKANSLETGLFASGLTTISINMDISMNSLSKMKGKNKFCVYPKDLKLSIYFKNPTIYISNQLKPDTCEYNVVLRHEQAHAQINKQVLEYFLPLLKKATIEIFKTIKPRQVSGISLIDKASSDITDEFNKKITPLYNYFKQQIVTEQQKLDNEKNYQYENQLCN
ncbi:MAG: hypothetical protein E7012_00505 [Alphaproteobacteria bacterium]|nr:hypothetical protein [Alphaproteobacteria bacterium]